MDRNRNPRPEPFGEVVALHHPGHGVLGRQLDHAARAQRVAPLGVVADLGLRFVQHQLGLGEVGLGVGADLLGRERRAGAVAARGVADQRGEVADQEDHAVPQVLELAHLVEHHRVSDMNIRCGRVQAQLDAQRLAGGFRLLELLHPLVLRQQFVSAAEGYFEGLSYTIGEAGGCNRFGVHGLFWRFFRWPKLYSARLFKRRILSGAFFPHRLLPP
ncbi:hypothetical protein D3C72_987230 [compost metagenome]